jgi:hypothetical protein
LAQLSCLVRVSNHVRIFDVSDMLANTSPTGFIACFSHAGVPTLSVAPVKVLVHEFKVMYNIGKSTSPPIAIAVTLCNVFSACQSRTSSRLVGGVVSPFTLFVAAALCVPCIVPYTLLYMEPAVNKMLLELGDRAEKGGEAAELRADEKDIREKLVRWRGMNFVRAAVVGVGALLAAIATIA